MNTKKGIILGILMFTLVIYSSSKVKIGLCSPEREILINHE